MKKIISLIVALSMILSLCASVNAEIVGTDVAVSEGKITTEESKKVNSDAAEKYGDTYRTTFCVITYDSEGRLNGVNTSDTKLNEYLTFGKEKNIDFPKIVLPEGTVEAKIFSWTDDFVKPEFENMPEKVTVHILGASTTTDAYGESSYPQQGWGYKFERFFGDNVTINNVARGGWSLKALQEASITNSKETDKNNSVYSNMMEKVKPGDFVIISSTGLNEQHQKGGDRYDEDGNLVYTWRETPAEYKMRLKNTLREIKAKGATPIVLIAMASNTSDVFAYPELTETEYATVQRELQEEMDFLLIDHRSAFYNYVKSRGINNYKDFKKYFVMSKLAKEWYKENDHVGKVDMEEDDVVHFTTIGAFVVADTIVNELKKTNCKLLHYIKY